ncbi:MAG: protein translocase subunit SecF [bacterium]|nr:protein translocase subunit SecF [bacterium]
MRLFWNTKYDFIKLGRPALIFSAILLIAALIFIIVRGGPNLGIDFTGGVKVDVQTNRKVTLSDLETIRSQLDVEIHSVGRAERELLIQSKGLGEADAIAKAIVDKRKQGEFKSIKDVVIIEGVNLSREELDRVFTTKKLSKDEARGSTQLININEASFENIRERVQQLLVDNVVSQIRSSLDGVFDNPTDVGDRTNLNSIETWDALYDVFDPMFDDETALGAADTVVELRKLEGSTDETVLLDSVDSVVKKADMSKTAANKFKSNFYVSSYTIRGTENIGPRVSADLKRLALQAMLLASVGMLIYIWIRFNFRSGLVAIIAVIHDLVITVGIITLAGIEINLTVIAGLLTVAGYSVNDTIVTYDRIREDDRQNLKETYPELLNRAINENLARTIVTGLSSLIALIVLFFVGGEALRGFSLTLIVGIVVGTYSSIYVAAALLKEWFGMFGAAKMGSGIQTLKSMTTREEKKKAGKGKKPKKK